MRKIFCPWVSGPMRSNLARLQAVCGSLLGTAHKSEYASLVEFLTDSSVKTYFDQSVWGAYGNEWKWVALLTLLKLWTNDLGEINYGQSDTILTQAESGFSLSSLIKPGVDVIFASLGSKSERITSIDKYSSDKWTVLLKDGNTVRESSRSLSVTLSVGELCARDLICLRDSDLNRHKGQITKNLGGLDPGMFGNFLNLLMRKTQNRWDSKKTFMALIAACFKDVENVSFTVREPSKDGQLIFKLMEGEK